MPDFQTLSLSLDARVLTVRLHRPEKANAIDFRMWRELKAAFEHADRTAEVRAAVLLGEGKHFCSGIDLADFMGLQQHIEDDDPGRKAEKLRALILELQACLSAQEACRKPVLAGVHGACIGGGLDLIAASDLRYCAQGAYFSLKEIDLGMVADVGSLQRLPKLVAPGLVREWAFTGRRIEAAEAQACGLVNRVFESREALEAGVREVARQIAARSPLAIRGVKEMLGYARDHSVAEGLGYIATWNAAMLLSEDLAKAAGAAMSRETPEFKD
jgi:enoyl-CoA hydratase